MPANRVPDATVPALDQKGNFNPTWWRFFARVASQFSGVDPPLTPVDAAGVLSIANAQPKPHSLSSAEVQALAQEILGILPRVASRDAEAEANALIALGSRAVSSNRESGALDLALAAQMSRHRSGDNGALDLALLALSRPSPRPPQTQPQIIICTQPTFPTLDASNSGSFIYVSDYAHMIYWNGVSTSFVDGGNGYYVLATAAPSSIGWHAVDGSVVNLLNSDGTLSSVTLKNVAGTPAYLKAGSGTDTLVSPVAPTISGTTGLSTATNISGLSGNDQGAGIEVQAGAGVFVAAHTHQHNPGTESTDPHTHPLSSATATISSTGEPEAFYSKLWIRL